MSLRDEAVRAPRCERGSRLQSGQGGPCPENPTVARVLQRGPGGRANIIRQVIDAALLGSENPVDLVEPTFQGRDDLLRILRPAETVRIMVLPSTGPSRGLRGGPPARSKNRALQSKGT